MMKPMELPEYNGKYDLKEFIGWRFGDCFVTGRWKRKNNSKEILWEMQCSCGSPPIYKSPSLLFAGKRTRCIRCERADRRGNRNPRYKGTLDIPRDVLGRIERGCKNRSKDIHSELTLEDLQVVWEKSEGKCAYTGLPIEIKKTASVDRIDSDGDYTKDNIQFVHKDVNRMKQDFTEDYFISLCTAIVNNRGSSANG